MVPAGPLEVRSPLPPNQTTEASLALNINTPTHIQPSSPVHSLQIAVKNNAGLFFFQTLVPIHIFFREDGQLPQSDFLKTWKEASDSFSTSVEGVQFASLDALRYDCLCVSQ